MAELGKRIGRFVLVVALVSCDPGDTEMLAPDDVSGSSPPLTVHASLDVPFAGLSEALGWGAGIPNARVRVHNTHEPYDDLYWTTVFTNNAGLAEFPDLLAGLYEVEVTRVLSEAESGIFEGDASIVAGGMRMRVPSTDVRAVRVEPNHEGSLVFSETGLGVPLPWETGGGTYSSGKYIELFNNSDAIVFLDGMVLGIGAEDQWETPHTPCAISQPFRDDPEGIWARKLLMFPGDGGEYPVEPGGVVLIARSAVDHSGVHSSLRDLSGADFEFGFSGAAGNPDVPNLVEVGPSALVEIDPVSSLPLFLADPVDRDALASRVHPSNGARYLQIPAEKILDVVGGLHDFTNSGIQPTDLCLAAVNSAFERLPGPATLDGSDAAAFGIQRRVLGNSQSGVKLLQDTNTSMADFILAPGTPGWVPESTPEENHETGI